MITPAVIYGATDYPDGWGRHFRKLAMVILPKITPNSTSKKSNFYEKPGKILDIGQFQA